MYIYVHVGSICNVYMYIILVVIVVLHVVVGPFMRVQNIFLHEGHV